MRAIIKLLTLPIVLTIDVFTWICVGMISCSAILFRLSSSILSVLAIAVFLTYSPKNGLILLVLAFLVSPIGLPLAAVKILGFLQKAIMTLNNL